MPGVVIKFSDRTNATAKKIADLPKRVTFFECFLTNCGQNFVVEFLNLRLKKKNNVKKSNGCQNSKYQCRYSHTLP